MTDLNTADRPQNNFFFNQILPLSLTLMVFLALSALVFLVILLLNRLPITMEILLRLRWYDILVGATVYLKTSVDFAIFMGRLMASNPGWKNRIAIEIGSALGNGLGTIAILILWVIFKQLHILLALMILLASLILLELAYAGLQHFAFWAGEKGAKRVAFVGLNKFLSAAVKITKPISSKIIPNLNKKLRADSPLIWKALLLFSFTVPFILGLDDFAGYVPLFNVVNVFGFSVGILGAHMLLNIALFISPRKTSRVVRNQWVSFLGTLAFVGLAFWGLVEAVKIFAR